MAVFNITKIDIDPNGRIHIYSGKESFIFGDFGRLEEMANRQRPKDVDVPIKAACQYLVNLPAPALEAIANIKNQPVVY